MSAKHGAALTYESPQMRLTAGQEEIQVYIFPFKMTDRNLRKHGKEFPQQLSFWQNLQQGYAYFAKYRTLPSVSEVKGAYLVK